MKLLQPAHSPSIRQEMLGKEIDGRYLLLERMGEGRSATVYSALDKISGIVALKLGTPNQWDIDTFRNEARALARMGHPSIVAIDWSSSHEDAPYIAMELVEGKTLRDSILSIRPTFAESLRITSALCAALDHAHSRGVVHRDVKPKNIMHCQDGGIKLFDFGFATIDGLGMTSTARMGNPLFMAPEQVQNNNMCDHRADIYAAGAVLHNLLGRGTSVSHFVDMIRLAGAHIRPDMVASGYEGREREARKIVAAAMAQDPCRRFQSAGAMREAIEAVLGNVEYGN
jgi:eukaryotic-like serine/threonine-protein kinase